MTHLAIRLVDPLPAIERLGCACPGIGQLIGGCARERRLATGHRHAALDRRYRPGVWLDVPLVTHRGEPTDFVHDRVGIARAQQREGSNEDRVLTHGAPRPHPLHATTPRRCSPYPIPRG